MADEQQKRTTILYQIEVQAHLDSKWSEWLYGLKIIHTGDGTTLLSGPLPDQAVLHSVLDRIRDMNLQLLSVNKIVSDVRPTDHEAKGESNDD